MRKKKEELVVEFDSPELLYNHYVRHKNWQSMSTPRMTQILDEIYPHANHLQKAQINSIRRKLAEREEPQFGDLEIIQ